MKVLPSGGDNRVTQELLEILRERVTEADSSDLHELPNINSIKYSIPSDLRREGLLGEPDLRHLSFFPVELVRDTTWELFGGNLSFLQQDSAYGLKLLMLRSLPNSKFLLENSLCAGDLGCFIGAGISSRNNTEGVRRAIDNLALGEALFKRETFLADPFVMRVVPTPKVTKTKTYNWKGDKTGENRITLPEACWMYVLSHGNTDFARFGVNLHQQKDDSIVLSITNIQGMDKSVIRDLRDPQIFPSTPKWPVIGVQSILSHLPSEITFVRGIPGLFHPSRFRESFSPSRAAVRYDSTFRSVGFQKVELASGEKVFPIRRKDKKTVKEAQHYYYQYEMPRDGRRGGGVAMK